MNFKKVRNKKNIFFVYQKSPKKDLNLFNSFLKLLPRTSKNL